jgi:Spy/CpxP family protein refolding chaperone
MKAILSAALVFSTMAFAAPPDEGPMQARLERRMRTLRVVGLAEALDLSDAEALRMDAVLRPYDEQRKPLERQVHQAMGTLRKAADGDAQAAAQVDTATQNLLDARSQLAAIDREMFNALAQGKTPQQKAKLALFLAHFQEELRGLRQMLRGPGHPPGPREMPRGPAGEPE